MAAGLGETPPKPPALACLLPWPTTRAARRDVIGGNVVIGDSRWAGAWGVRADFIAKTTCSVLFIPAADIMVAERGVCEGAEMCCFIVFRFGTIRVFDSSGSVSTPLVLHVLICISSVCSCWSIAE